jgi:hypothetical protein
VALLCAAWPLVHGCGELDGGAVEVSWRLVRSDTAETINDCGVARIDEIELWWEVAVEGADVRHADRFSCDGDRGVSRFDVPVGDVALWLRPACENDVEPAEGSFVTPPPIVRNITEGEVITLDTQLIEVRVTGCTDLTPCICEAP